MKIKVRYSGDGGIMKWIKLSIFAVGALIAIPMIVVAIVTNWVLFIGQLYISWLKEVTNTDVNW